MTINRVNTYQGGTLTVAANLYGNGGGTVWQLTEWRPNCNALIAETAIDGDRAELDALRDELEDLTVLERFALLDLRRGTGGRGARAARDGTRESAPGSSRCRRR